MNVEENIPVSDVAAPQDMPSDLGSDPVSDAAAPVEDAGTVPSTEELLNFERVDPELLVDDPLLAVTPDCTIPFAFLLVLGIIFGIIIFSLLSKRWAG